MNETIQVYDSEAGGMIGSQAKFETHLGRSRILQGTDVLYEKARSAG